ncbi:WhiB family transcriptional regulator [Actinosynnema sp. NPDC050436]|uniref:WhiB family transcriptional regulator n=1 Tax=Actinosynnema sp. NPDC050436 TaxID=3155659 RepID=UPI0033D17B60
MNPENYYEVIAVELDRFAAVPDEVLWEIVTQDGCQRPASDDWALEWDGEGLTDRELAARLCADCPERLACLELELRTAGVEAVGVRGGLSDDDRRALYLVWVARRDRMGGSS